MFPTPFESLRLALQTGQMLTEAQLVITLRLWGMAGLWNIAPEENLRMVQEKFETIAFSTAAATRAAMAGKGSAGVVMAALKPVRRRTRNNARRLSGVGPR
ncbi:MAG: antifreeze protein [Gemmobacter sp.]|nr:antifreeze protein [Gemmobacter sp.]